MPHFQDGNEGQRHGATGTLVVTQPPHFPTMHTRETATYLAAFGLDEKQIAVILRCTADDVRKYYSEEVEHGLTRVNSRVMSAVLHQALQKEDVGAMKLWLINKAGWRSGDGNKTAILTPGAPGAEGEITVAQRREIITRVLTTVTQVKRHQERVIEGEVVTTKKTNGTNGGHGSNGNGSHGHGTGGGNGAKHR